MSLLNHELYPWGLSHPDICRRFFIWFANWWTEKTSAVRGEFWWGWWVSRLAQIIHWKLRCSTHSAVFFLNSNSANHITSISFSSKTSVLQDVILKLFFWKCWYFSSFLCQKVLAEGNCYGALDINTPRSSDGVRKLRVLDVMFFPSAFWLLQQKVTKFTLLKMAIKMTMIN